MQATSGSVAAYNVNGSYGTRSFKVEGPIALHTFASVPTGFALPGATVIDTRRKDIALMKAYAGVTAPDADVGVMLAEASETLRMLTSPLKSILKLANKMVRPRTFKRAGPRLKKYQKAAEYVRDAWLVTRFGILPTIKDVNDLIKAYHSAFRQELNVMRRSSGGMSQTVTSLTQINPLSGGNMAVGNFYFKSVDELSWTDKTASTVYYNRALYRNPLGLSMYDIPSVLWERVPYSFVVDWSLNIGTWLRRMQPDPGLRYLGNTVSTKRVGSLTRNVLSGQPIYGYPSSPIIPCDSVAIFEASQMIREVNATIPVLPVWNPGFESVTHGLDSLSLIWQKMPKFKR
jgi:hypothetical protein